MAVMMGAVQAVASITPWASLLVLLFMGVRKIWGRRSISARSFRLIWIVLALRLAIPVNISLPAAPVHVGFAAPSSTQEPGYQPDDSALALIEADGEQGALAQPVQNGGRAPLTWQEISVAAPYVWAAGVMLFLAFHAGAYALFFVRLCNQRVREMDSDVCSAVWLAFGRKTQVYRVDGLVSPMLAGFWRPAVYLPADVGPGELPYVLEHEAGHREARDILFVFLMLAANAVQWFNPAVYWMVRTARRDMELACDESVLESRPMEYRVAYGEAVLDTLKRGRIQGVLALNFCGRPHTLKERFSRMVEPDARRRSPGLVMCAICLVMAASLFVAGAAPVAVAKEDTDLSAWEDGNWTWPVPEYGKLTSVFEPGGVGVRIEAPEHTPVVAVRDGIVTTVHTLGLSAEQAGKYGNTVVLYHGDGSGYSFYAQCEETYVEMGQEVSAGQLIASTQTSENGLLFGLWANGEWMDPMQYLSAVQPAGEPDWARLAQLTAEMTALRQQQQNAQSGQDISNASTVVGQKGLQMQYEQAKEEFARWTREMKTGSAEAEDLQIAWPVPGCSQVIQGYYIVAGTQPQHNGIDIAAPEGTPVYAANDGTVFLAEQGGEPAIGVRHETFHTLYMGLSGLADGIEDGTSVNKGQLLGFSGKAELCGGQYALHFELVWRDGYADPQLYWEDGGI